jgi:Arc/MetJ-type ribon-helix-helix transcriptional regulator
MKGTKMAVETERITVRVPSESLAKLEELVKNGKFDNKSDVIRAAIDKFLEDESVPSNIAKITVDLPKGNVVQLEELVDQGDSVSVDDAIRNAVRDYLRTNFDRIMKEYEEEQ